jgi:hypothetical protein
MKYGRGLVALLALAGCVSAAAAGPPLIPAAGLDNVTIDSGLGLRRVRHGHLSLYLSGGFGLGYSPYACGPSPGLGFGVISIYSGPPAMLMPSPVFPPLAAVPPPQVPLLPQPMPQDGPPPGQVAGGFRPLVPADRPQEAPRQPARPPAPAPQPPKPPAPKPKDEAPKPKPAEQRPPELPRAPRPEVEPRDESARQVRLGRAAFAAGQYGRASHHFRLAIVSAPGESEPHFLLAQSLLVLGKYAETVAAIHEGLRLQPDWPLRQFRPLELYGDNVADYPEHLAHLEEALARTPDDAVLLFLYAYELWFDGRQDEALPLFQRAAGRAADPGDSLRFLGARPPGIPMI